MSTTTYFHGEISAEVLLMSNHNTFSWIDRKNIYLIPTLIMTNGVIKLLAKWKTTDTIKLHL